MSLDACAEKVARGDPERFAAAMTAPMPGRADLMVLYAFNLEIARAPWVTAEPMIAQMRLQWWLDALDEIATGATVRDHEVVTPLAALVRRAALPGGPLRRMVEARGRDIEARPLADLPALWDYLDATAGSLTRLAAQSLGAEGAALDTAQRFGRAAGAAQYLRARPELIAAGRDLMPEAEDSAAQLIREARADLARARAERTRIPRAAAPALAAGWLSDHWLRAAEGAAPDQPLAPPSEFRRRAGLLWVAATGRW